MIGWQHPHNGHGLEQALEDREGQEIVVCCGSWGCKELDTTERLNNKRCPWELCVAVQALRILELELWK